VAIHCGNSKEVLGVLQEQTWDDGSGRSPPTFLLYYLVIVLTPEFSNVFHFQTTCGGSREGVFITLQGGRVTVGPL
jgi:hypothetical protein